MKKLLPLVFFSAVCFLNAQNQQKFTAYELRTESLKKDNASDSILYLKSNIENTATLSDKRSALHFLGRLQEMSSLYSDASYSYAQAAGITAGDAKDMPKVSSEQLVLDAVRTSLNAGETANARSYLNSAVRSSKDAGILAYVNLYTVWCSLCEAETVEETTDSIELLKAYASMKTMQPVKPQVLLTLWYLTSEKAYSDILKAEFPKSPETAIVNGTVQIACVPFYFFVPRKSGSGSEEVVPVTEVKTEVKTEVVKEEKSEKTASKKTKTVKRQVGFFKAEENARRLVQELKGKGFDAVYFEEKRSGGTVYYIVAVNDNEDGTTGLSLMDAGYESYVLE